MKRKWKINNKSRLVFFRFAIFFFLILIVTINAQSIGYGFIVGSPQGEFKSNVNRNALGIELQGSLWTPSEELPYSVGLDASYIVYGVKTESMQWFGYTNDYFNVTRKNSIFNFHAVFQVFPFFGSVRPYLEGLIGGALIYTNSELTDDNDESIASITNIVNFTWSYGAGGGILVSIAQDLSVVNELFLDFKVRYMNGTEANYFTENDFKTITPTQIIFYPNKSKTDLLTFQIGVVAYF